MIFSGQLLLALTNNGISRETAYEWVQRNAMKAWDENDDFKKLVKGDSDINAALNGSEVDKVFSLDTYLRNVDTIFARVFRD